MALDEWKEFVGNSATIFTIIQFLVGIQVCAGFYRNKTTGETSCMTFLVGVVMTFVWFNYGKLVSDNTLQTVNGTGLVLQTLYTFCFYNFTPVKIQTGKKIFLTLLVVILVQVYIYNEVSLETAQLRIGMVGASMSIAYCSAPLASIQHVFRTRSTESLPYYLILATVVVTGLWSLYGHIIHDSFVKIPNMIGFSAALFQFSLFYYFPNKAYKDQGII